MNLASPPLPPWQVSAKAREVGERRPTKYREVGIDHLCAAGDAMTSFYQCGCAHAPAEVWSRGEIEVTAAIVLTMDDNGTALDLQAGEGFSVRLEEPSTTGFSWAVQSGGEHLLLLDSEYLPQPLGAVGGSSLRTFTFRAERAGVGLLRLRLWREWEGDSSVIKEFSIEVRIVDR